MQIVSDSRCRGKDLCESCENQILYALEVEQLKKENGKHGGWSGWCEQTTLRIYVYVYRKTMSLIMYELKIQCKKCCASLLASKAV